MDKRIMSGFVLLALMLTVGFSGWWNTSFPYCLPLNISTIEAGSPNSAINISLNYHTGMDANFSDIRFINAPCNGDGSPIAYWRYYYNASNVSKFYINSSGLPGNTVTNYSIYYGNPTAVSLSDLDALIYDNNGTRNITVFQDAGSVAWATSEHGSYPAGNVRDSIETASGYGGSWVTDTGSAQIVGIKLPYVFTAVKSMYRQPVVTYSVIGYEFKASYDNTTYVSGWKTSFPNTEFLSHNSTVNFTNLPVTGQYFEFLLSQDAAKGVGSSEIYLFGFNTTSRLTYMIDQYPSEWQEPNPEPEPVNGSVCVRIYATRPRFLWNQSDFSYFAGDYYENIILPGSSVVLNSLTNSANNYCSEYVGIVGNAKACFSNVSAPESYSVTFHPNLNCYSPPNSPDYTTYRLGDLRIEGEVNASYVTAYSQPPVIEDTAGIKGVNRIGSMFYEILKIGIWIIIGGAVIMSAVWSGGNWIVPVIVFIIGMIIKIYIAKWGL